MPIEPLYNHCFVCDQIGQNDLIPVGGGMLGSSDMPWKVNPDYQNFYPRFSTFVQPREAQFKTPEWHNYFSQNAPNADPELLQTLQAFTQANEGRRQKQSAAGRNATYRSSPNTTANLSDIFKNNQALCVEPSYSTRVYKVIDFKGLTGSLGDRS